MELLHACKVFRMVINRNVDMVISWKSFDPVTVISL